MMAVLSAVMNGSNEGDVKEKKSAPSMPFHQLSGRKHKIRPRESVKMLDADLRGRVMEMEFFWNMQKKERRVRGSWQ